MRKIIQIQILLFLCVTMFLINSCKKGDAGPAGPEGKAGSANITSSTFSVTSWSWSSPYYYSNLSVPALTSTNVNTAAVMVYFRANTTSWSAVPYTQYHSPYDYFMGFNVMTSSVQVTWFYDSSLSSGSDPNAFYGTTVEVKVVVIPPAMIKKNVDMKSYEEMSKAYNLKN